MQYSQGQLRKAVGLTVEAYRHWKKVLPPFSSRKGHSAKLLIGDILAVAVLKRLTDVCSIKVGNLAGISDALFNLCNTMPLDELENLMLHLDLKNNVCKTTPLLGKVTSPDVFIVVPLANVIYELRADLLEMQSEDSQGQLIFPTGYAEGNMSDQGGFD
ncbi:MAG: hypothetical protein GY820_03020 [Gammaproteobacteria bacterium]|nr:hypothetical protein [Gammaproteobacteria bacterium]